MTVEPQKEEVANYIQKLEKEVLDKSSELWLIGRMTAYVKNTKPNMKVFGSIESFAENL